MRRKSIEDPVVMPKALAALAGQALQKILNHLKEKGEYPGCHGHGADLY